MSQIYLVPCRYKVDLDHVHLSLILPTFDTIMLLIRVHTQMGNGKPSHHSLFILEGLVLLTDTHLKEIITAGHYRNMQLVLSSLIINTERLHG